MRATIDGLYIGSLAHLHQVLARELRFPAHYGANLDALHDCLTALPGPAEIVLRRTGLLEVTLGRRFHPFLRVLRDAQQENPGLTLTL